MKTPMVLWRLLFAKAVKKHSKKSTNHFRETTKMAKKEGSNVN